MIIYELKDDQKYLVNGWNEYFLYILSAPCKRLLLRNNKWLISEAYNNHANIIKEISHINFMNLTSLSLSKFMIKKGVNIIKSI